MPVNRILPGMQQRSRLQETQAARKVQMLASLDEAVAQMLLMRIQYRPRQLDRLRYSIAACRFATTYELIKRTVRKHALTINTLISFRLTPILPNIRLDLTTSFGYPLGRFFAPTTDSSALAGFPSIEMLQFTGQLSSIDIYTSYRNLVNC
jgi:hypothetical protein